MATTHPGRDRTKERKARVAYLRVSPEAVSLADATESINFGLRAQDGAYLEWEDFTSTEVREGEYSHGKTVTLTVKTFSTDINTCMLNYTKLAGGLVQAQVGVYNQAGTLEYLTFYASTSYLDFNWEFVVEQKDRYCEIKMKANLTNAEWDTLWGTVTQFNGTTGGTTLGLTAQAFSYTLVKCAGIDTITITNSSGSGLVGRLSDDTKINIKTTGGTPDERGRTVPHFVMVECPIKGQQVSATDQLAWNTDVNYNVTTSWALRSSEIFKTTSGACSLTQSGSRFGDGQMNISGMLKGLIPLISTTGIDCGVGTSGTLEVKSIAYA